MSDSDESEHHTQTAAGEGADLHVNELLCYVQNVVKHTPADIIRAVCVEFYSDEEVQTAKKRLSDALVKEQNQIHKRYTSKTKERWVELIINLMTERTDIPLFLARDVSRLPTTPLEKVDLNKVFRELSSLRSEVNLLSIRLKIGDGERARLSTQVRNMVLNPSFCSPLPSFGSYAPPHTKEATQLKQPATQTTTESSEQTQEAPPLSDELLVATMAPPTQNSSEGLPPLPLLSESESDKTPPIHSRPETPPVPTYTEATSRTSPPTRPTVTPPSQDWQVVKRKKDMPIVKGTGQGMRLKARPTNQKKIYVGNLAGDTTANDVVEHLAQFNLSARCIQLKVKSNQYSAFLILCETRFSAEIQEPVKWPEGTYIRPYIDRSPQQRTSKPGHDAEKQ